MHFPVIRHFSLIPCSALVIILCEESVCTLVFMLGFFFFSRFLSWLILKELHRGNLPSPHSKLPALVTSRAFYSSGAFFPGDKFEFTAQPESNRIKRGALQGSPRVID